MIYNMRTQIPIITVYIHITCKLITIYHTHTHTHTHTHHTTLLFTTLYVIHSPAEHATSYIISFSYIVCQRKVVTYIIIISTNYP